MKIISKFHDYYDGVTGYGFDDQLVYRRSKRILNLEDEFLGFLPVYPSRFNTSRGILKELSGTVHRSFVVLFCGVPYYGIILEYGDNEEYGYTVTKSKTVYRYQDVPSGRGIKVPLLSTVKKCFSAAQTLRKTDAMLELHRRNDSPVILISRRHKILVNPCLKDFNFMNVVDPFTAYQDIERFLGNELVDVDDAMVRVSNESLIEKKGFDDKSFRKGPTKRKRGRSNATGG